MGGEVELVDDLQSSLIDSPEQPLKRTGTQWTAVAHIITGVIGAGVLSLAWSVAQLGWILGPVCIIAFAFITVLSTFLVCDCYKHPDPEYGPIRNRSYMEAVKLYLGQKPQWISGVFMSEGLYGTGIAYTITAAASVRAILKSNCYHREGHDAPCEYGDSFSMLLFGLVQIVMSQIPGFQNMYWLSAVAAVMSFSYASIGFGLGFAKVIENGTIKGSITGVAASSVGSKVWACFEAIGDITFAYPYVVIVLEIQDTLKASPPENQTMKKASVTTIVITTFFYLCCGCFGYAAFGAMIRQEISLRDSNSTSRTGLSTSPMHASFFTWWEGIRSSVSLLLRQSRDGFRTNTRTTDFSANTTQSSSPCCHLSD